MPAAFGRLRVETLMSHFCACGLSDQPPSGGCELKRPEFEPKVLAFAQPPSGGCELKPALSLWFQRRFASRLRAAAS